MNDPGNPLFRWIARSVAAAAVGAVAFFTVARPANGAPRDDVDEVYLLRAKLQRAFDKRDWPTAIEVSKKLIALAPTDGRHPYNLACVYALSGDRDAALHWLGVAADTGWSNVATTLRDRDLDSVRGDPRYNAAMERIRGNNARELEVFKLKAGRAVVLTFLPPRPDPVEPAPLLVAMHGYGGNAAEIANVWRNAAADAGAILIAPQGLGRAGTGFHWGKVEEGEYLILRAIEKTRQEHRIDDRRVVLTGFSQGGGMAFIVAIRHPEMFGGVIPVGGFYDHDVTPLPAKAEGRWPRFDILNGANDAAAENNRQAAGLLEAAGVPVRVKLYEGVGHAFPPNRDVELSAALRFVLAGE